MFGIHHSQDDNDMSEREPLIPGPRNDDGFPPPPPANMLSVSDDSDFYKERKGSISILQILQDLPDDKMSKTSSKSRILSESDDGTDSESVGSTGVADSYDLLKSRASSQDLVVQLPVVKADDDTIISIPVPEKAVEEEDDDDFSRSPSEPRDPPRDFGHDRSPDDDDIQSSRL